MINAIWGVVGTFLRCRTDQCNLEQMDFEGSGDGDWVSAFKADAGPWTGAPLVVLSLFDGLGGIWQALTNLGVPFSGYSSEVVSSSCIRIVRALC